MKSKKGIALALCFGALVCAMAMVTGRRYRDENPKFWGGTLEFWLDEMREGQVRSNKAHQVFLDVREKSVGFLTNQLSYVPTIRKEFIKLKLRLLPLAVGQRLPKSPQIDWQRRMTAAFLLGELGAAAREAVPSLLTALSSTETGGGLRNGHERWVRHRTDLEFRSQSRGDGGPGKDRSWECQGYKCPGCGRDRGIRAFAVAKVGRRGSTQLGDAPAEKRQGAR